LLWKLLNTNLQIRKSPTSEIETVNLGDMYRSKASDIQMKVDQFNKPQSYNIDLSKNYMQKPFADQLSQTAITGAGITNLRLSPTPKLKSTETTKLPGLKSASPYKGLNLASVSSGKRLEESISSVRTPSAKSIGKSKSETSKTESPKSTSGSGNSGKSESGGSSGSGSGSSGSYYSSGSSYSEGSTSSKSSSDSSMGNLNPTVGGLAGTIPFLAAPGGGGGGGMERGHAAGVIQNPLAALEVAGKASKYFNFKGINNFVKNVKGNSLKSNPLEATNGLVTPYSASNAIASVSQASAIARKSKRNNIKVKRKSEIKISQPELTINSKLNFNLVKKRGSKKKNQKNINNIILNK